MLVYFYYSHDMWPYLGKQPVSDKINYCIRAEVVVEHEDANGITENEVCFTQRQSVRLASNLDSSIFTLRKR